MRRWIHKCGEDYSGRPIHRSFGGWALKCHTCGQKNPAYSDKDARIANLEYAINKAIEKLNECGMENTGVYRLLKAAVNGE